MVPAFAFASAPRLHDGGVAGLRPDEVPAILQKGERVLTRAETRAFERARADGGVTVNIMTTDAESFRRSRTQVTEAALGLEANWRVGPAQKPVADRSYRQLGFTPEGVGLRPFSVGHVAQPWRTARVPGDLGISWTRRSRALAADGWNASEVPVAEESEAYEVEILDGALVKRTLSTAATSVTYTAAQQTADWGALLTGYISRGGSVCCELRSRRPDIRGLLRIAAASRMLKKGRLPAEVAGGRDLRVR